MPTDLPSNPTTTAVVTVGGGRVSGHIDKLGDSDWYAVTLVAGVTYQFNTDSIERATTLALRDSDGTPLFDGGRSFVFTAERTGTFYLDVGSDDTIASGDYFVSADIYAPELGASDVAGSAATAAEVVVGGPGVSGVVEDLGDSDWYSVRLEAGHTYALNVLTTGATAFTVPPIHYAVLRDAAGVALTHSIADGFGKNDGSAGIVFTAAETGNYFLDVRSTHSLLGYEVRADEFVPSNDPVDTITTTAVIAANGTSLKGLFETANDGDWYGVTLTAGVRYSFTIDTRTAATLVLRDESGAFLNFSSTDTGTNPSFIFTPSATGKYFLDASTRTFLGGEYEITVDLAAPDPADIPGDATTTASVSLDGTPVAGTFDRNVDNDWFRVSLTEGVTYQFDLLRTFGFFGGPVLALLDADGTELRFSYENRSTNTASLVFTAEETGIYYLDARNDREGEYLLSGREFTAIPGDVIGDNPDMAGALPVNGVPVAGAFDDSGDSDWYAVTLEAGHSYRFTTTADFLSFPELTLRSPGGLDLARYEFLNPSQAFFSFTASISGTYYLDVTSSGSPGNYEIAAVDLTARADVPGDVTTPETLAFDVPVFVELDAVGDSDWYAIQLAAGQSYSVRLASDAADVNAGLYDATGQLLASGASNRHSNIFFPFFSEFIHFTALTGGTYYVAATLGRDGVPSDHYMLDVVPDDLGDNADTAGIIAPGTTALEFENFFDADFVRLQVESGKIYTLSWDGTPIDGRLTIDGFQLRQSTTSYTFSATDSMPVFGASYLGLDPTAEYTITLIERTDIVDDHGDTTADATAVQLGTATAGVVEAFLDHDVMKVSLEAGRTYSFDVAGTGARPFNRFQFDIKDADGNVVASSSSFGPRVFHFGPTESGTYYLDIGEYDDVLEEFTGTYEVKISEDSPDRTPVGAVDGGGALASKVVKVHFAEAGHAYPASVIARGDGVAGTWSADHKAAVRGVFGRYEAAVNIKFVEVGSAAQANFVLVNDADASGTFFGAPGTTHAGLGVFGAFTSHTLKEGGAEVERIAQAIGRGLGLKAPQEAGADGANSIMFNVAPGGGFGEHLPGLFGLNQSAFTVMSGNQGWSAPPPYDFWPLDRHQISLFGHQIGPAALDIAALQAKYGANTTFARGANVYTLVGTNGEGTKWQTIWDTGGTDEIRYGGFRDALIDLNDATGVYAEGGGGFISNVGGVHGGFTIARGVTIENARGGTGDDRLIGNEADNRLLGNAGDDMLDGGAGKDRLEGDVGNDGLTGGAGNDRLAGDAGNDRLTGGAGNDAAYGGSGADVFVATAGDGSDRYDGGGGRDMLDASAIAGAITVDLIKGRASSAMTGHDHLSGIEDVTGGGGNDTIVASAATNRFAGGAGDDRFAFRSEEMAGIRSRRDQIADFVAGDDRLDVSGIDANQSTRGNQAFAFAGLVTSEQSGLGNLERGTIGYRYFVDASGAEHTLIEGNTGGSRAADMQIDLIGRHVLTALDFVL